MTSRARALRRCLLLVAAVLVASACSAAADQAPPEVRPFPTEAVADYQLGGAYRPADDVTVVVGEIETVLV